MRGCVGAEYSATTAIKGGGRERERERERGGRNWHNKIIHNAAAPVHAKILNESQPQSKYERGL